MAARCRSSTRPSRAPSPASATRRSRSTTSSPTSTSTSRSSARRTSRPSTCPVFACSMGDNTIHYTGHVRMMGAVQPFISGAISKTVEHARGRRPSRRSSSSTSTPGSSGSRRSPSIGTTARSASRFDDQEGGRRARPTDGGGVERASTTAESSGWLEQRHRPESRRARSSRATRRVEDLLVPGRRLRGLRDGRRVRGRSARRGVHQGLEAGLDPRRDHGRLLDLGEPRAPARRAARVRSSRSTPTCASSRRASPTTPSSGSRRASSTTSSGGSPSTT